MKPGPKILSVTVLLVLVFSCTTMRQSGIPSIVNVPSMYNPVSVRMHPVYAVYHESAGQSDLIVKIFPSELLYSGGIEPNQLLALVRLKYTLTDISDPDSPVLADSGTVTYKIPREEADRRFVASIPLKAGEEKYYQLMIVTRDQVRREENTTYMYVDKRSRLTAQNFMITDPESGVPLFQPYVNDSTAFRIMTRNTGQDRIFVSWYGNELPVPRPAFSDAPETEVQSRPDSTWVLPLGDELIYTLNNRGIYHFRLDTTVSQGLTLFNFGGTYPEMKDARELIEPLIYLSTSAEFRQLQGASNPKLALDNFWLEKAGNTARARELIRVYYNRVYYSNHYFTSMKPGWKTDRGMIFIIFGPPQTVTTVAGQEKWIYYRRNYSTSVTFTFNHVQSDYSLEEYELQRSENYDSFWRQAVDTWRRGGNGFRVFEEITSQCNHCKNTEQNRQSPTDNPARDLAHDLAYRLTMDIIDVTFFERHIPKFLHSSPSSNWSLTRL